MNPIQRRDFLRTSRDGHFTPVELGFDGTIPDVASASPVQGQITGGRRDGG